MYVYILHIDHIKGLSCINHEYQKSYFRHSDNKDTILKDCNYINQFITAKMVCMLIMHGVCLYFAFINTPK